MCGTLTLLLDRDSEKVLSRDVLKESVITYWFYRAISPKYDQLVELFLASCPLSIHFYRNCNETGPQIVHIQQDSVGD